ncbi:hypothetical protein V499_08274 [Pseudogymnoascus sp. VKM F-103]|nr:hypothetical protein V499_08274 [Pseudogymnoascus sp. VKM F-103]
MQVMRDGMHVASTTGQQATPMLSTCASGTTDTPPIDRPQMVFHDGFHATAPLSHSAPVQTLLALPPPTLFSIFFEVGVSGDPAFSFARAYNRNRGRV